MNRGFSKINYEIDAEKINSIYVRDSNKGIDLETSKDGSIHVTYYDNEKNHYKITNDGGKLSVIYEQKFDHQIFFNFGSFFRDMTLTVSIPEQYAGYMDMAASNGRITASNIDMKNDLKLETSNARICLNNMRSTENLFAKTSNGKIEVQFKG